MSHSQERIVPPHAAELVIAHHLVPRHPQRIRDLALLLHREQNIALHAEHKRRRVRERAQAICELGQVRWRIRRRRVRLGVR